MASNTKLAPVQKQILRDMKADYPHVNLVNDGKTTVAYYYAGNTVKFAFSVMSPDEKKFRLKVGEYIAMSSLMHNGQFTIMERVDFNVFILDRMMMQ